MECYKMKIKELKKNIFAAPPLLFSPDCNRKHRKVFRLEYIISWALCSLVYL